MNKSFNLILCEIHNEYIHGFIPGSSTPSIKGHWICHYVLKDEYLQEHYDEGDYEDEDEELITINASNQGILSIFNHYTKYSQREYINRIYLHQINHLKHEFIKNYKNIVLRPYYLSPQIAKIVRLSGDEDVAILKTFWIRCIQRCWKNLYRRRKEIISKRKAITSLIYKELHGIWPGNCRLYPQAKGLFWHNSRYLSNDSSYTSSTIWNW